MLLLTGCQPDLELTAQTYSSARQMVIRHCPPGTSKAVVQAFLNAGADSEGTLLKPDELASFSFIKDMQASPGVPNAIAGEPAQYLLELIRLDRKWYEGLVHCDCQILFYFDAADQLLDIRFRPVTTGP